MKKRIITVILVIMFISISAQNSRDMEIANNVLKTWSEATDFVFYDNYCYVIPYYGSVIVLDITDINNAEIVGNAFCAKDKHTFGKIHNDNLYVN